MKKMRRLIPAIAMLLVSAVMLSTASFAWFTMNEQVTATGMQVQAKASGNLVIGTGKLNAASKDIITTVTDNYHSDTNDRTKVNLAPITYDGTNWKIPASTNTVDPLYGTLANNSYTTLSVDAEENTTDVQKYFAEYVVYVATAGDELKNQNLFAKINAIGGADQTIAPAYTVAFYVVPNGTAYTSIDWNNPVDTVNYKDGHTDKVQLGVGDADTADFTCTVPSTYGTNSETAVGLMIVMRVYVDGDLSSGTTTVEVPVWKTGTGKYDKATMEGYKFYKSDDVNHTNEIDKTLWTADTDLTGYVYTDGDTTETEIATKYVNNNTIPAGSTKLEVEFSVDDDVANS